MPTEPDFYLCKIKGDRLPFRVLEFWKHDLNGVECNQWRYNYLIKYENIDIDNMEVTDWMKIER